MEKEKKPSKSIIMRERIMEMLYRLCKGEKLSKADLAKEYQRSEKTIGRYIQELKAFFDDHRETVGYAQVEHSRRYDGYYLEQTNWLTTQETMALLEILIGSRALKTATLNRIVKKLKEFTTPKDRKRLEHLIAKEIDPYDPDNTQNTNKIHKTRKYCGVHIECDDLLDNLWRINEYIESAVEITIGYQKMDGSGIRRRIRPLSIMFEDYYFYLVAIDVTGNGKLPKYYRIDRIKTITRHKDLLLEGGLEKFDEGELRRKSLLMWPGPKRTITFEFTGPSIQAIQDKLPTANAHKVEGQDNTYIVEAEVQGDGIKMFLLSQGSWVKVLGPDSFVREMKEEVSKIAAFYNEV